MLNDSSINAKKKLKNIKWREIFILQEFKCYLSNSDFIEISTLNQFLREKLRQQVLYKVKLNPEFLLQFPNYFYRKEFDIESEFDKELETIPNFQSNRIDPFMTDLIRVLNSFDSDLLQIEFDRLYRPGYYIVPCVSKFGHLTGLSICDCELELKGFNKFIQELDKLEYLSIKNIEFLILAEENPLNPETFLPNTLKELELGYMNLKKVYYNNTPYEYLFYDRSGFLDSNHHITAQKLPNLKKLKVSMDSTYISSYFPSLMDLNPQLKQLAIPCYYLSSSAVKPLSNAGNLNELHIAFKTDYNEFRRFDFMPLESVNSLSIKLIPSSQYRKVYTLVNLCQKITKFNASLDSYSDEFIKRVLKKLDHLKTIELEIKDFTLEEFDLSIFSNMESLKLNITSNEMIRYKLPEQLFNLKSIKITSNNYKDCFNFMLEEYSNSPTWNIKLLGKAIRCRAITS
ncbi:hypothetical protein CONCODRAFT_167194 [Conidiobolus coronatus NRRL 28638]|uniref:RNI-like protein n=1 Tax=Conidiobolus coronatus (strain ATCC 28846 / CBS 209.66 / NRRL 28638) TaxID=796925 RepID=A0A137NY88_CONC2|nr:hypothetical protein CONCODRAFT_167194 [Conidiobolus coronatus NRRL 28638]|eukprot:KXN67717.1 hypothetical protein CONCODRAFT_167194 [Conidiobolus coronatus NRRL 28638]